MTTSLPIQRPEYVFSTVGEYVSLVYELSKTWSLQNGYIWFRGEQDDNYTLVPKIYRGSAWKDDEDSLVDEFMISWPALGMRPPDDAWERYGYMQHYGLPTRLLDWTKSPLTALYFAIDPEKPVGPSPGVWVMDPYKLNKCTTGQEVVIVPSERHRVVNDIPVYAYLPESLRETVDEVPAPPIAIEPPMTSSRIAYQQGCFVVFGQSELDLRKVLFGHENALVRLAVKRVDNVPRLQEELFTLGIKEDLVWQDMNKLSSRISRERSKQD